MTDPLKRPLTFGDKDQIAALKEIARKKFWDSLEKCDTCDGYGECQQECQDCGGIGLPEAEHDKFMNEFPGWLTWDTSR